MKILLKNTANGQYLGQRGWVDTLEAARSFPDEERAREYFTFRKLPNITVVKLAEPGEAQAPALRPEPACRPVENRLTAPAPQAPSPAPVPVAGELKWSIATPATPQPGASKLKVTSVNANIDVGFGNSLFIRGEGAGLSWEKGQPLRCVDGTTWNWSTTRAQDKVVFKLLLNDRVWAIGGDSVVQAGHGIDISPNFEPVPSLEHSQS